MVDGRILTWSLETHVTDHCNLRCANCCTLSPALGPWSVNPDDLRSDLERAAAVLRPNVFKLTGGEPLLHPEILRCVDVVRESRIADQVSVTTNGLPLARMADAFFDAVDRLTLSWYSSAPLPERRLAEVEERCRRHDVVLTVKRVDRFARMTPDPPLLPPDRAAAVHASCWLRARCHLVYRGQFYTCTRPPHLEPYLRAMGHETRLAAEDGVSLAGPDLLGRLVRYLESEEPLASCRYCLGASGTFEPHRQVPLTPGSPPSGAAGPAWREPGVAGPV